MGEKKFTPEQLTAIESRNKTLLVSAAAGSGKTATLTERIIRSLTRSDAPEDISRMLIVTFTNAAVGELRERIAKAIEKALSEDPENKNLARQLTLLPMAKICTIDSFCNEILKKNSDKVGISPSYRIADAAELEILSYSLLEAMIDAVYEDEIPELMSAKSFSSLANILTSSKHNSELEQIFLSLYEKSKSTVEGISIFEILKNKYESMDPLDNEYTAYALSCLKETASHYIKVLKSEADELNFSATPSEIAYADILICDTEKLEELLSVKSYCSANEMLEGITFKNLPSVKGEKSELQIETVALRTEMKDDLKKLRERFFFYSDCELRKCISELSEKLSLLSKFLTEFDKIYTEEKNKRQVLEYSDIERLAYLSLYEGNGAISDFAKSLRQEFSSVYIDEYQDVNALQAKIFDAVSSDDNRFMVGDIKQSIYGFRSAEPDIFASMKKSFPKISESHASCASIFMSKNFRSDRAIIDFVNGVFDKAFGLTAESIGYLPDDRLDFGKIYEDNREPILKKPKFILIPSKSKSGTESNDDEDDEDSTKRRMFEAKTVAEAIKELLTSGKLNDGSTPHPSDIAIVMRGNRQRMSDYSATLDSLGIPSEKADDKSFFLNPEVLLALCLLNAIDNPSKDIYLAGLMCSPIFSFTPDELVLIRAAAGDSLYLRLKHYTAANPGFKRGEELLTKLSYYRTLAEGMNVDSFVLRLFNDTGLFELAEKNDGQDNLLLLYNYAKSFSASSLKGLYNFIKFINNIIERGTKFDTKRDSVEKDAVHITTVHSSKGLEYPIVFYVDTDTALTDRGSRDKIAFSEKFGLAMRLRSPSGLAIVENPIYHIINHFNSHRYFEEELRVIYVALTRAREQLYVVGCIPEDSDAFLEKTELNARFLDGYSIYKTKSALELMLVTKPPCEITVTENHDLHSMEEENIQEEKPTPDTDISLGEEELLSRIEFKYGREHLMDVPEKLSVSVLSPSVLDGSENDEISFMIEREKKRAQKRDILPEFVSGTHFDESARRGIATHNFMQFFDISELKAAGAKAELERLCDNGFISEETKKKVRLSELVLFEKSNLFREMINAKSLLREFRFNIRLPARYFTSDPQKKKLLADEELLVQGVIDCLLEDSEGNLHLLDYKTDRLTKEELQNKALAKDKLNKSHALQLSYYSLAIQKIFEKEVKTVRVYSLPLGDTVDIERVNFE